MEFKRKSDLFYEMTSVSCLTCFLQLADKLTPSDRNLGRNMTLTTTSKQSFTEPAKSFPPESNLCKEGTDKYQ